MRVDSDDGLKKMGLWAEEALYREASSREGFGSIHRRKDVKLGIAGRRPFVTTSGIEAIQWWILDRNADCSTAGGFVLISLPRVPSLERPMLS